MNLLARLFLVVVVTCVVFLIAGILATWAPDRSVQSLSARWAPAPSQFIEVEGMQVHVRDEGPRDDATPIVLLHGTSASLHTWEGWATALRAERRVIRFDLPAFGLTGPHPQADYSIDGYVRFVHAVMQTLHIPRFVLAGNSLGGQIAWNFALKYPDQVAKLILVDSAGYTLEPESIPLGFQVARMPGIRWFMEYILPRGLVESSVRNVYGDPSKVTPALVDRYYELTLRTGNRLALVQRFQQPLYGNEEAIAKLRQPTLILWGSKDRLITPAHAHRFKQNIASAQLQVFDGLGHVPHEEDPERTASAAIQFLKQP